MVRIVAVADTHTYEDDLVVPDGDIFVHAGDLLQSGSVKELCKVAKWLHKLPHANKIIVAGNHDRCFQYSPKTIQKFFGKDIIYLEDKGVTIQDIRFWGSPWQPEYNDWAFNLPRGFLLAEKWALIDEQVQVLITHSPPYGIGDSSPIEGRKGCRNLRAAVHKLQVPLHIFGHIHQDGGAWLHHGTWFVNATTWECERPPTVIDFCPRNNKISIR